MRRSEVAEDDIGVVANARAAWARLGCTDVLTLEAVELWWVDIPFRTPVSSASTTYTNRPLVLVKLAARVGPTSVEGWGECAALGPGDYVDEDVGSAFATLERQLAPALIEDAEDAGGLPPPSRLVDVQTMARHAPMAFAALEMAVADAHLRAEQRSLASLLGLVGATVEAGAVVGTFETTPELVEAVGALVRTGYRRVKMKIAPGSDIEPLDAVTTNFPSLRIQVDANGSYSEADAEHLSELDRLDLLCLEQPYPAEEELAAHARLATKLSTPLCLDESLHSPTDVVDALAMGGCSVVGVKPARLGGIGAALQVIESCVENRVPMWIGGMFESGFARGVNTALATLPGFAWPGDLSPAATYLAADIVPASGTRGSTLPDVDSPEGPGMSEPPDPELLEDHRVRHVVLSATAR
jgi:o-succinylbenzoate synthase